MPRYAGFTGTRRITPAMQTSIDTTLACLPDATIVVTGGCIGVDAYVARGAQARGLHVYAIIPANRRQVDPEWATYCTTYKTMPEGTDYRDRNVTIVLRSDCAYAFPEHPEADPRSRRSGTWMTIRMCRKLGVPVYVHIA